MLYACNQENYQYCLYLVHAKKWSCTSLVARIFSRRENLKTLIPPSGEYFRSLAYAGDTPEFGISIACYHDPLYLNLV